MRRRAFLNVVSTFAAASLVPSFAHAGVNAPMAVAIAGKQHFKGTADGKILVSQDAGNSWRVHADFGADFAVTSLNADGKGAVQAGVAGSNTRFKLKLNSRGNAWMSA